MKHYNAVKIWIKPILKFYGAILRLNMTLLNLNHCSFKSPKSVKFLIFFISLHGLVLYFTYLFHRNRFYIYSLIHHINYLLQNDLQILHSELYHDLSHFQEESFTGYLYIFPILSYRHNFVL